MDMYLYFERIVKFGRILFIYTSTYTGVWSMNFLHLRCICVQPRF